MTISGLIEKAGGLVNNTFSERVEIERINSEDNTKSLISLNLDSINMQNKKHDILLRSNDRIRLFNYDEML